MVAPASSLRLSRRHLIAAAAAALAAPAVRAADASLRFVHAYGEIELPRPASRVVSLGYNSQDCLLALGVVPLAVRYWYGDHPFGIWPWAQPYLGGAEPVVMTGEVAPETVLSLQPDLIVGIGSGISQAEYAVLSQIAPVLMHEPDYSSYGTPWDAMTRLIGLAVGQGALAEERIASVNAAFAAARGRHPGWNGATAVAAWNDGGQSGAFSGADTRARFLTELGFRPTEALAAMSSTDNFYTPLSPEDLSAIDADLLIWISSYDRAPDIVDLPMRRTLRAHREGREIFCGELLSGALSFGSVLSLPFALEALEPDMVLAMDGDPGTPVPSSLKAGLAP